MEGIERKAMAAILRHLAKLVEQERAEGTWIAEPEMEAGKTDTGYDVVRQTGRVQVRLTISLEWQDLTEGRI